MARLTNEMRSIKQATEHLDCVESYLDFLLLWAKREIAERRRLSDMEGEARLGELNHRAGELIKHVQRAQRSLEAGQRGEFVELPVVVPDDELLKPIKRSNGGSNGECHK